MNYFVYFLEVKNRIFLTFLTWLSTVIVGYVYKEIILFYVINSTNNSKEELLYSYFIFTDVTEIFQINIKLIIFLSTQVLILHFFYNFLVFISSGLYNFEYKKLYFFVRILFLSFLTSITFLNSYLIPISWKFFLGFQNFNIKSFSLFFEAKISEYLIFYTNLYYFCFFSCLLCLLFFIFAKNYSNNVIQIKTLRKGFYFSFFFISTAVTPPDVFSQLFLSFFIIILYEIIIFLTLLNSLIRKPVKTDQYPHSKH